MSDYRRQTIGGEQFPDHALYHQQAGYADDDLEAPFEAGPTLPPEICHVERREKADTRTVKHSSMTEGERKERASKGGKARSANISQRQREAIQKARRDRTEGITVAVDHRIYKRDPEKWQAYFKTLPDRLGPYWRRYRWSYQADFFWDDDEFMPQHLYRFGFKNPPKEQTFDEWNRERRPMNER